MQTQSLAEALHSHLLLDGESVYPLVANPFLLLLARVILVKCSSRMGSLQVGLSFSLLCGHIDQYESCSLVSCWSVLTPIFILLVVFELLPCSQGGILT